MLSGFFISTLKEEATFGKVFRTCLRLWLKVFVFSFSISVLFWALGITEICSVSIIRAFTPILSNQYWFITVFLAITAVRPLWSRAFFAMSDKEVLSVGIFLAFFDCIQPLFGSNAFRELGTGFLHAFFCVVLGYACKRLTIFNLSKVKVFCIYVACCCIAGVVSFVEKKYLHHSDAILIMYNSPLIVTAAIALLCFFKKLEFSSKVITGIAPYVLGIYLFNDHPLMRGYVYENILHCSEYYSSNFMLIHYFVSIIGFTIIGLVLDFIISKVITIITKGQIRYA